MCPYCSPLLLLMLLHVPVLLPAHCRCLCCCMCPHCRCLCCCSCVVSCLQDAPVIISATDAGVLQVYRMVNIAADRFEPPELQQGRLEEALRANVMKAALTGS